MTIKGQDWASYQSATPSVRDIDFAFIKATEATGYVNPKMSSQAEHARRHGLVVGFYHFLRPGNMKAQAAYFVRKAASLHGDPLWADWEDPGVSCHDKDTFIKEVIRLRGKTHRVGLYCNTNYWWTRDTTSYCGDSLWIATYNGRPGHPGVQHDWDFHQYTSTPVDTNIGAFSSRSALRAWCEKGSATPTTAEDDDDMPSAKDIVEALAKTDGVFDVGEKMKRGKPANEEWQLESILAFIGDRAVDNMDSLSDLEKKVKTLSDKVDALDLSGLVSSLESLKLRIDVTE